MNTHHTLDFFRRSIFFVNDWADKPAIEETTLESFLREYCQGDQARAWCVIQNKVAAHVWRSTESGDAMSPEFDTIREANDWAASACRDYPEHDDDGAIREVDSDDDGDLFASAYRAGIVRLYEVTRWEVREGLHSTIDSFSTAEEAEEYLLNGLYWNFSNKDTDAPFSAPTREECEAEIAERNRIAEL